MPTVACTYISHLIMSRSPAQAVLKRSVLSAGRSHPTMSCCGMPAANPRVPGMAVTTLRGSASMIFLTCSSTVVAIARNRASAPAASSSSAGVPYSRLLSST